MPWRTTPAVTRMRLSQVIYGADAISIISMTAIAVIGLTYRTTTRKPLVIISAPRIQSGVVTDSGEERTVVLC